MILKYFFKLDSLDTVPWLYLWAKAHTVFAQVCLLTKAAKTSSFYVLSPIKSSTF